MTTLTKEQAEQINERREKEQWAALPQLTAEMKGLRAELEKAGSLTVDELETLKTKTYDFLCDFQGDFEVPIPTIRPEVPEEARQLFVTLYKLVDGIE